MITGHPGAQRPEPNTIKLYNTLSPYGIPNGKTNGIYVGDPEMHPFVACGEGLGHADSPADSFLSIRRGL